MIYEVRTYTLRPGTVAEFEERYAKRLALREQHSKLTFHRIMWWNVSPFSESLQR